MTTLTARTRRRATRPAGSPDAEAEPSGPSESLTVEESGVESLGVDGGAAEGSSGDDPPPTTQRRRPSRRGLMWTAYVLVLLVLGGVAAWIAVVDHRTEQDNALRDRLLAGARQTALNMTTLQAGTARADVDRLLAGASGDFLAQFQDRQSDFVDVVGQAGVNSTGAVVSAGVESTDGDCATALVAADAEVSNVDEPTPAPRSFRFRITVCEVDGAITANAVEFVP
jgi:Mce-associated membrane protein